MKKILLILSIIIIGTAVFIKTINLNKYKPFIEVAVYDSSGYTVRINGRISVSLLPSGVRLPSVTLKNPSSFYKKDIADIDTVSIGLNPLSLFFHRNLKIESIRVYGLKLKIVLNKNGVLNIALKPRTYKQNGGSNEGFNIDSIVFKNAKIEYENLKNGNIVHLDGVNIKASLKYMGNAQNIYSGIQTKGTMKIKTVKINSAEPIKKLSAEFSMSEGILNINPIRYKFANSDVNGDVSLDFSNDGICEIRQTIDRLNLENLSKTLYKKLRLKGFAGVRLNIYFGMDNAIKSLNGSFVADSRGIILYGEDLDKIIAGYQKTSSINAIDIGSFFIVGPLGILADKAYSVGYALTGITGKTRIRRMLIKVKIKNGKGYLSDAAFSTDKNRIAAKGVLDFEEARYENVRVAVLDKKGCAKTIQRINGSFSHPKVEVGRTITGTIVNEVTTLFKKLEKSVGVKNVKCAPFYRGAVKQP